MVPPDEPALNAASQQLRGVHVRNIGEQPWVKCQGFGLADPDFLESGMREVEEVVGFSRDDLARQSEHRRPR